MANKTNKSSAIDTVRNVAIIGSLTVLVLGGLALFPGVWEYIGGRGGDPSIENVDFENLTIEVSEDAFLACPIDICLDAEPQINTNDFPVPLTELRNAVLEFIDSQPGIRLHNADPANNRFTYLDRDIQQQFPDVITVQFFPRGQTFSTVAIFSRTVIGAIREGRNEARIRAWLENIDAIL